MTTEAALRNALDAQFDRYSIGARVRDGTRHAVYEVVADGRRAACKLTDCQPATLAREGAVLRAVAERTPVPVPAVLAAGDGYLVLEWRRGEPYGRDGARAGSDDPPAVDDARRRARLRAIGRTMARLHGATEGWFAGHGELVPGDGPLCVDDAASWPDRFLEFTTAWADAATAPRDAAVGTAVVETVAARRDAFADCSPVLVHGEVCPEHVRFDGEALESVLDWESSQAAPGEFDLAWAERDLLGRPVTTRDHAELRGALIRGYEADRPLPPGFRFRRELYRAAFALRELGAIEASAARRAALRSYAYGRLDAAEATRSAAG